MSLLHQNAIKTGNSGTLPINSPLLTIANNNQHSSQKLNENKEPGAGKARGKGRGGSRIIRQELFVDAKSKKTKPIKPMRYTVWIVIECVTQPTDQPMDIASYIGVLWRT